MLGYRMTPPADRETESRWECEWKKEPYEHAKTGTKRRRKNVLIYHVCQAKSATLFGTAFGCTSGGKYLPKWISCWSNPLYRIAADVQLARNIFNRVHWMQMYCS